MGEIKTVPCFCFVAAILWEEKSLFQFTVVVCSEGSKGKNPSKGHGEMLCADLDFLSVSQPGVALLMVGWTLSC